MILLIDNYDSFVYNLARYVGELGFSRLVKRNDAISVEEIAELKPSHIVISPGPCTPNDAGISMQVIKTLGPTIPILGVCLGHQAIGQAFGGKIVRAKVPMHGKAALISHDAAHLFDGLPNPLKVARYHSLVVSDQEFPEELQIIARSEGAQEIMALQHRRHPIYGVQFHPESVLTKGGYQMMQNFLVNGSLLV